MSMVKEALRTEETKTNEGRTVAGIVNSIETLEGGGFLVRRPFPKASFSDFDPFLLLDEMGPMDVAPGEAKGAPDHPHRGFETVTYMLSGDMEHKDSSGHAGRLSSGDVQWMTAGAGVVHAEMPSAEFMRTGGRMHGFQLWVNLPRQDKMIKPRYQEIPSARIPKATSADGLVSVSCDRRRSDGRESRHRDTDADHLPALPARAGRRGARNRCRMTTTPSLTSLTEQDCSEQRASVALTDRW